MPTRDAQPLLGTSHFRVLIGKRELGFAEVTRLTSHSDPTQPTEGSHVHETVVLRRALSQATELYDWRRRITSGKSDRRVVTIEQLAEPGGEVVNAWQLLGAWPCRWTGPSFDAAGTALAIEELELSFDDLVWLPLVPAKSPRSDTKTRGA